MIRKNCCEVKACHIKNLRIVNYAHENQFPRITSDMYILPQTFVKINTAWKQKANILLDKRRRRSISSLGSNFCYLCKISHKLFSTHAVECDLKHSVVAYLLYRKDRSVSKNIVSYPFSHGKISIHTLFALLCFSVGKLAFQAVLRLSLIHISEPTRRP